MYSNGNEAYFVHQEIMPSNLKIMQTLRVNKLQNDKWLSFVANPMNRSLLDRMHYQYNHVICIHKKNRLYPILDYPQNLINQFGPL